jgi:ubiquitin carboxyl-terminal hydrolase L3
MKPQDRAQILEDSAELESIYAEFAEEGDSSVPANAEEEVDFHFICFAKNKHSTIYELDGDQKGPIDKGVRLGPEDDMLSEASLSLIKDYLDREAGANICFNLMALVKTESLLGV